MPVTLREKKRRSMNKPTMADRICITGVGVVSSIGIGKEEFLSSLKNGKSGIEEIKEFDTNFSHSKKGGIVRSFHPKVFIPAGKIRRLDRASQFAIAASKLALADASFSVTQENSPRVGVVLGSGFCGLSSSEEFHRGQVLKGFLDLNPMLFPNTVPNAPSSYVSIELGIQGVNSTLVQSFCTAEAAIIFACDQLRKKKADLILTGGVDELSEFLFRGFSELHLLATDLGRSIKMTLEGWEGTSIDYLSGAGNSSKGLDALEAKGVKKAFQTQSLRIPVSSIKSMTGEAIASGGRRRLADGVSLEN